MNLQDLPTYTCHKTVRAFKIGHIVNHTGGRWTLIPRDDTLDNLEVGNGWYAKHRPEEGGYYVAYEDGYTSFSPAEAFEKGYTLTPPA